MSRNLSLFLEIEREKRNRTTSGVLLTAPDSWDQWLQTLFPKHFTHPFADRHVSFWEWIESIKPGVRPRPFVGIWGRGGAKSTNAEGAVIRLAAKGVRKYAWYISSTQDKADQHVDNVSAMLEASETSKYYPKISSRAVNKFGHSKGWRRSRLRTASGFTIDSLGLDTGARGAKVEEQRPDIIIIDDVDELFDKFQTTNKKIRTLTQTVLPAGSFDCAVLFIQNLIHSDSIASMLYDGRADFLTDRIVSGIHPAVENLVVEQRDGKFIITGGRATWAGQDLKIAQQQIDTWGYSSFMQESQHEVDKSDGLWSHIVFRHVEKNKLPLFVRTSVWVDPAVSSTDESDSMGIAAGGITKTGQVYGLYWWEQVTSPEDAIERAIMKAIEIKSTTVGIETDQGGDTWKSVYLRSIDKVRKKLFRQLPQKQYNEIVFPKFVSAKAGGTDERTGKAYGSKVERNTKMLSSYENGEVIHMVGTHVTIEKALYRFPKAPLDVADAWFWCWDDLKNKKIVRGL